MLDEQNLQDALDRRAREEKAYDKTHPSSESVPSLGDVIADNKKKLEEIRKRNQEKREAEAKKAQAERAEHIKQIDKQLGKEKISQGKTKAEDDANYRKLEKDVTAIKKILAKEKSRENFGQEEIRKLRDKYADYMSGNWSVVGRFTGLIRGLEDWAKNYQNW